MVAATALVVAPKRARADQGFIRGVNDSLGVGFGVNWATNEKFLLSAVLRRRFVSALSVGRAVSTPRRLRAFSYFFFAVFAVFDFKPPFGRSSGTRSMLAQ